MSPTEKPKFAMYWAASCGGCEIAVLNTSEKILDVDRAFDVAFWPVAMDAKYKDVEALPDGAITLTLFNGGMRNSENEHVARLLRQKSKILVAFGSCACEGCVPGLANLGSAEDLFDTVYSTVTTEADGATRPEVSTSVPEGTLTIPRVSPAVRTLDAVVPVDYYMPGCPPESHQIAAVIDLVIAALQGQATLPPPGSVIGAGHSTVCDECRRTRHERTIASFRRIQDGPTDPTLCLLEQGIPCNGPATRNGCGALCPAAGAQCIGCYGPTDGALDYGARLLSAFGSIVEGTDPAAIDRVLDTLVDPVGQLYRFNLAGSLLGAARATHASAPGDPHGTHHH